MTMHRDEPPADRPDFDRDVSDLKAMFRDRFPGWSIIRTDRGRWWATRPTLVREDLSRADGATYDANTPAELYVKLEDAERRERNRR